MSHDRWPSQRNIDKDIAFGREKTGIYISIPYVLYEISKLYVGLTKSKLSFFKVEMLDACVRPHCANPVLIF